MAKLPNILFMCSDHQQGRTVDPDCPCITPTAGRLAREGIRFSLSYTPVGLTGPAHASLLTGLYPTQHGVLNNWWSGPALRDDIVPGLITYSRLLNDAGYELSTVGGFPASPQSPEVFGYHNVIGWRYRGAYRKPSRWPPPLRQRRGNFREACIIERPGWGERVLWATVPGDSRQGQGSTDAAIEEMRRLARLDKPWMLRFKHGAPHDPYVVSERFLNQYDFNSIELPESFADDLEDKPAIYRRQREELWKGLSEEDYRKALMHFWALTTAVDEEFGHLVDALEETGQAEDTLVIYTSDHGDMATAHKMFLKGVAPFEEAYRIPLVIRWPSGIKDPGRVCEEFVSWVDLAATIVDAGGAGDIPNCAGTSLRGFFENETPRDWQKEFFGQFTGVEYYYTQRIIRDKEFKLVFNGFDFDELYDMKNDPHEMKNLARDPAYEEVKRQMYRRLWDRMIAVDDPITGVAYPTVSLMSYGPYDE